MTGQWFSLGTMVSSTNKTDGQDIAEILLKVVVNTILPPSPQIIAYSEEIRPRFSEREKLKSNLELGSEF